MRVDESCGIIEMKKPSLVGIAVLARGLCLMQVNYPYCIFFCLNEIGKPLYHVLKSLVETA